MTPPPPWDSPLPACFLTTELIVPMPFPILIFYIFDFSTIQKHTILLRSPCTIMQHVLMRPRYVLADRKIHIAAPAVTCAVRVSYTREREKETFLSTNVCAVYLHERAHLVCVHQYKMPPLPSSVSKRAKGGRVQRSSNGRGACRVSRAPESGQDSYKGRVCAPPLGCAPFVKCVGKLAR